MLSAAKGGEAVLNRVLPFCYAYSIESRWRNQEQGLNVDARLEKLYISGALLFKPPTHRDVRGDLTELYQASTFRDSGVTESFVQDNLSTSAKGVLRGLHFQLPPVAQSKLVRVLQGDVSDVIVDLRKESPTYGQWQSVTLQKRTGTLYVPKGCAHGFCVLSKTATVLYKLSAEYAPESQCGIAWNDPGLAIPWPVEQPIVSPRDAALPNFQEIRWRLTQLGPAW